MKQPVDIEAFVTRLEGEIAEAERRLSELRLARVGALAFRQYAYADANGSRIIDADAPDANTVTEPPSHETAGPPLSPTELVLHVLDDIDDAEFDIDRLWVEMEANPGEVTREQVRSSIHYLIRQKRLIAVRRGVYARPTNTETPARTGVSEAISF
ncbi:hypothetical protein RHODO2019_10740 [Rhodococcus antarcticus]|uniref:AbiEi antitoxin of type IV toxin-antitoxin system n=1 Tax=Rhodococcus antarcticus TaxID=2987751 RepID=A0ABY6NWB3_9NOCA|nr:hypothetical protein [Rhodococcus antarcticus]UZJ23684.1 hypothetical protein RHODO2019_10740 [Rhodococcus antarcticus]